VNEYFLIPVIFIAIFLFLLFVMKVHEKFFSKNAKNLSRNIKEIRKVREGEGYLSGLLKNRTTNSPLNLYLKSTNWNWVQILETLIVRSGIKSSVQDILTVIILLLFSSLSLMLYLNQPWFLTAGLCVFSIILPIFFLRLKETSRIKKFNEQLPDCLDYISRALRSGNGLVTAIGQAANDSSEPIASEFRQAFDEINFGLDFKESMANLGFRVRSEELNFFITSLMIQRESGGNLSELLAGISKTMRDRFKLDGKVKGLSAEGRLSAYILSALPVIIGIAFYFINPNYISKLWEDEQGIMLLKISIAGVLIGYAWAQKIAKVDV
jgi:tight adherence protein B